MRRDELVAQLMRLLEAVWQMKSTCFAIVDQVYRQPSSGTIITDARLIRLLHSSIHNSRAELAARGYDRALLQSSLSHDQFENLKDIAYSLRDLFEAWDNVIRELELLRFAQTPLSQNVRLEDKNQELIRLSNDLCERASNALHLLISRDNVPSTIRQPLGFLEAFWTWLTGKGD
jgi:hypothetical protein